MGKNRNRNYDAFDNQQKARGFKDRYDSTVRARVRGTDRRTGCSFMARMSFRTTERASSPQVNLPTAAGLQTINTLAHDDAVRAILKQIPAAPANNAGTVNVVANGTPRLFR